MKKFISIVIIAAVALMVLTGCALVVFAGKRRKE